jgi:hypothetical protein
LSHRRPSQRKEYVTDQMEWPLVEEGATPASAETVPRPDLPRWRASWLLTGMREE